MVFIQVYPKININRVVNEITTKKPKRTQAQKFMLYGIAQQTVSKNGPRAAVDCILLRIMAIAPKHDDDRDQRVVWLYCRANLKDYFSSFSFENG